MDEVSKLLSHWLISHSLNVIMGNLQIESIIFWAPWTNPGHICLWIFVRFPWVSPEEAQAVFLWTFPPRTKLTASDLSINSKSAYSQADIIIIVHLCYLHSTGGPMSRPICYGGGKKYWYRCWPNIQPTFGNLGRKHGHPGIFQEKFKFQDKNPRNDSLKGGIFHISGFWNLDNRSIPKNSFSFRLCQLPKKQCMPFGFDMILDP